MRTELDSSPVKRTTGPNQYDIIRMTDDQWGNPTMALAAAVHFARHPGTNYVMVIEHAGWYVGIRRDATTWATANDMAVPDNRPRPNEWSGRSFTYPNIPTIKDSEEYHAMLDLLAKHIADGKLDQDSAIVIGEN